MGLRFQRRVSLGKGLRLNVGKSGMSLSAGSRWAGVNIGGRGVRTRASLPGTGISWVSGGRRGGDSGIGTLVVVGLALWLFSALATVLIVGAAVALVGGLIWLIVKHTSNATPTHLTIANTGDPPQAPPPVAEYQPRVNVDLAVFDEPTQAEVAALKVFRAWTHRLPSAPRDATDTVRGLKLHTRLVGRLVTECVGRHVAWKSDPYAGRKALTGPPVPPESVDPWTADPDKLRTDSRHYASCDACAGEGKIACAPCAGYGRLTCADCGGQGKVYGFTANGQQRLLNCKSCRGRGDIACPNCSRGRVSCATCAGKKKVDRWLEVIETPRWDIQVEPDGDVTRAFRWGKDGVPASDAEIAADARVVTAVGMQGILADSQLPADVPRDWIAEHWQGIQPQLQPGERIRQQHFALLEIPTIEVAYSLDNAVAQTVDFEGRRMLAPPPQVDQLFSARARKLRWIRWGLWSLPIAFAVAYLSRGQYFQSAPVAGLIACIATTCLGVYGAVWAATLNRRSARAWLPVAVFPTLGAVALAFLAEPRLGTARAYIESGDYESAQRELAALGGPDEPGLAPTYADLAVAEALGTTDWEAAKEALHRVPADHPGHGDVVGHIDGLLAREIDHHLALAAYDRAEELLAETSEAYAKGAEGNRVRRAIASGRGIKCIRAENWTCAFDSADHLRGLGAAAEADELRGNALAALRKQAAQLTENADAEKDRPKRIELAKRADTTWTIWHARSSEPLPKEVDGLRRQLEKDTAAEAKAEAQRQKDAERARLRAERERERERVRLERARKKEERRSRGSGCCKICTTGCACGDSCISCSKTCRKGAGCACDG